MKTVTSFITCFCLLIACKNDHSIYTKNNLTENEIIKTEISPDKIKIQQPELMYVSQIIDLDGIVVLPPSGKAVVCAPAPGFIRKLYYNAGQSVKKGALMAKISNQEYITLQKDYLETKYQLEYYENDYKRQGELTLENASSIKNMERSKADFWALHAKYKSLEARLKYLGINTKYIEEQGFLSTINLYAPVSGEISMAQGGIGIYIDSYFDLYEIICTDNYHLQCNVPGFCASKIRTGDTLVLNDGYAIISGISPVINPSAGTVVINAKLFISDTLIKPGLKMHARFKTDNMPVIRIPHSALIRENNEYFLFIEKEGSFVKIPVNNVVIREEHAEIIHPDEKIVNSKIVVEGLFPH